MLFTLSDIGYSDWLSAVIAADLGGAIPCNQCPPGTAPPLLGQTTASLIPQVSEYQFLTSQGPEAVLPGGFGPAILGPTGDVTVDPLNALMSAGGPGYVTAGPEVPTSAGSYSYDTYAFEPDGSLLEGTVTFDVYDINLIEKPVAATAEPAALALFASGALAVIVAKQRGRQ